MVMVAGALLAAGRATRFDPPGAKLRAPLGGRPLVDWALAAFLAARCLGERLVVVGADTLEDRIDGRVATVRNENPARGLASSLALAVAWARELPVEGLVVGLADQPFVPPSAWDRVALGPADADVVVATYAGARANPVRIARRRFEDLPVEGDAGARVLFGRTDVSVVEVACEGDPLDVDTRDDLGAARARLAGGEPRIEGG